MIFARFRNYTSEVVAVGSNPSLVKCDSHFKMITRTLKTFEYNRWTPLDVAARPALLRELSSVLFLVFGLLLLMMGQNCTCPSAQGCLNTAVMPKEISQISVQDVSDFLICASWARKRIFFSTPFLRRYYEYVECFKKLKILPLVNPIPDEENIK